MKPERLIIHAPNWVGDHVMAFPFYMAARALFASSEITLIGRSWISSLLPKDTFDQVHTFDQGKNFSDEKKQLLASFQFQTGITLSPSFRSAWVLRKLMISRIVGYRDRLRAPLISRKAERGSLRIPPAYHFEHRALSYIRLLNVFLPADIIAEDLFFRYRHETPEMQLLPEKKKEIEAILKKNKLAPKKYLVICPGSVAPAKIYPVKHLVRVVKLLHEIDSSLSFVFVGSAIEKPYAAQILAKCAQFLSEKKLKSQLFDLTTQTDLSQLHYVLRHARAVIANDSGVAHLTSLTHTPLVSFQGMGRKEETIPLNKNKRILTLDLACSPCFEKQCPRKDYPLECLEGIQPATIVNALKGLKVF